MKKAGALAAAGILKWLDETGLKDSGVSRLVILAGKGCNGGDAFVAAGILADFGYDIQLYCTVPESELSGDVLTMFRHLPPAVRNSLSHDFSPEIFSRPHSVIIDGLLGTGFHGELREPYKTVCAWVNRSGHPVIALDIPSGLDADTGKADPDAVVADITFTMAAPKTGMFSPEGIRHTGRLRTLDIGIPAAYFEGLPESIECTGPEDVRKTLQREPFDCHKYSRGHLFIAGGCKSYPGAPLLAAEAGLRTGAGLTTCCLPEHAEIYAAVPKALIIRRFSSQDGFFRAESAVEILAASEKAGAFVIGPGMGTRPASAGFLEKMLGVQVPILLDADALNLLSLHPVLLEKLRARKAPTVLTPHPGEMQRLMSALKQQPSGIVRQDAAQAARDLHAFIVHKGPRTIVASPDGRVAVNLSGCPALATAGTGDILSGMIGAFLLNREMDPFDAIRAAVFLHGVTAEITAPLDSRGFIADDFLPNIGPALRRIQYSD